MLSWISSLLIFLFLVDLMRLNHLHCVFGKRYEWLDAVIAGEIPYSVFLIVYPILNIIRQSDIVSGD